MAALSDRDRIEVWADLMRRGEAFAGMEKSDLRAAVDALDDWIEGKQSNFNGALPLPARTALTKRQKALLFMAVADKKFKVA